MRKIRDTILSWCENPEEGAIQQALNISQHPCLIGNVCLMPDCHQGYGMPIGGVVALEEAISPNMVGVDIGCGMLATKTSLNEIDKDTLYSIWSEIKNRIPLGFSHHSEDQYDETLDDCDWGNATVCSQELSSAWKQLGTLGGGNHFIEIQKGDDNHIWFMIHSGSRNLGYKVASYYNDMAEKECLRWKQNKVVEDGLAFFPCETTLFYEYIREMNICLAFALRNRIHMAECIKDIFCKFIKEVEFDEPINIHHNYASLEHHFGKDVWVHRKGATLARKNTIGIIPGSQGTCSYIVQGLGNEASLCSCSHGAGRKMGRKEAQRNLNLESEIGLMNDKGIIHSLNNINSLDEAPGAYKDIDEVMEQQKDLVKILVKLNPLAVVKG